MKFDIEEWIERSLPDLRINASGQAVGECPFCGKAGRFYCAVTGGKIGSYICFKCEEKGRNPSGLIAHVEGITRGEAMQLLMKGAELFRRRQETPQSLLNKIRATRGLEEMPDGELVDFGVPEYFTPIYSDKRKNPWRFPAYLKERKVKRETAKEWGLGYCTKGYFGGRLVVPVSCPGGRSFTARDMSGELEPKYMNPQGADHSRLLLGWDKVKITSDIAIVEGPLDVIKAWQAGIPALALMGKNMSPDQAAMLRMKAADCAITLMLDPEEVDAPQDIAGLLSTYFAHVSIATMPAGEDPGSLPPKRLRLAYRNAKKWTGRSTSRLDALLSSSRKNLESMYQ